jgi:hypothetical protein
MAKSNKQFMVGSVLLSLLIGPFRPATAQVVKISVPGTSTSAPTAVNGIVYFLSEDKDLNAVHATDGSVVTGFPVDVAAASDDASKPIGRPVVYYGNDGLGIYVATDKAGVVRVSADGSVKWVYKTTGATLPTAGSTNLTVAVTPEGEVFTTAATSSECRVVELKASDGTFVRQSANLTPPSSPAGYLASLAVDDSNVYAMGYWPGLAVLNRADLTVKASRSWKGTLPPYLLGPSLFAVTDFHYLYKMNRITLADDLSFGSDTHKAGYVGFGDQNSPEAIFADTAYGSHSKIFVAFGGGLAIASIEAVSATTGDVDPEEAFHGVGLSSILGPLVAPSPRILAFGETETNIFNGNVTSSFVQRPYPGGEAQVTPLSETTYGSGLTMPTLDVSTNRFFIVHFDQNGTTLYGIDRMSAPAPTTPRSGSETPPPSGE